MPPGLCQGPRLEAQWWRQPTGFRRPRRGGPVSLMAEEERPPTRCPPGVTAGSTGRATVGTGHTQHRLVISGPSAGIRPDLGEAGVQAGNGPAPASVELMGKPMPTAPPPRPVPLRGTPGEALLKIQIELWLGPGSCSPGTSWEGRLLGALPTSVRKYSS